MVSSTLAGAALGSLLGGGVSDTLGRRKSFLLAAVPMLIGPLLSAQVCAGPGAAVRVELPRGVWGQWLGF